MIAEEAISKLPIYLETFRQNYRQLMELWKAQNGTEGDKVYRQDILKLSGKYTEDMKAKFINCALHILILF